MKLYPKVNSNEWVQPIRKGYKMACCDCGQFRARRNNRATGQFRRYNYQNK